MHLSDYVIVYLLLSIWITLKGLYKMCNCITEWNIDESYKSSL